MAINFELNLDAFSDGQMGSKLWLCEQIEKIYANQKLNLWILGSWYGTLAFMLLNRGRVHIQSVQLVDIDAQALQISKYILNHWEIAGLPIRFIHEDIAQLEDLIPAGDLVINTSCEHMPYASWLDRLSPGTQFLAQTTDMKHVEHTNKSPDLNHFIDQLGPLNQIIYRGQKDFAYPNFRFSRFMVIAQK